MIHEIVNFVATHASWAAPIMFLLSLGESFAFVSLLFPGTTVMIAAGAFIPSGTLKFWPLVIACVTGAIAGDAISFGLGRRYGHLIEQVWPFTRHPELLTRGFAFFQRHGGKSIFISRFFGPLRAVIPLVAGISKISPDRFWLANILSALVWAPALLLPGIFTVAGLRVVHAANDREWALFAVIAVLIMLAIWVAIKAYFTARN